jgi:cell division protein FtsW (lipid II flippase)
LAVLGSQTVFRGNRLLSAIWFVSLFQTFVGGVFLQNSRTVFYLFSIGALIIVFAGASRGRQRGLVLAAGGLLLGALLLMTMLQPQILDLYQRALDPSLEEWDSAGGRVQRGLTQINNAIAQSGLIGHGTGSSSLGLQYVTGSTSMPKENGYAALIWEFGPIGPLVWLFLMGSLIFRGWYVYRRLTSTAYAQLALAMSLMFGFALVLEFAGLQYLENYLVITHFWALAGMHFALPRILETERVLKTVRRAGGVRDERPVERHSTRAATHQR